MLGIIDHGDYWNTGDEQGHLPGTSVIRYGNGRVDMVTKLPRGYMKPVCPSQLSGTLGAEEAFPPQAKIAVGIGAALGFTGLAVLLIFTKKKLPAR